MTKEEKLQRLLYRVLGVNVLTKEQTVTPSIYFVLKEELEKDILSYLRGYYPENLSETEVKGG